jgi:transposase-like protein
MKLLTELNLADLWKEVKTENELWAELKDQSRQYLKMLIENILKQEQKTVLLSKPYERCSQRTDYRNGYYLRDIESSLGLLKDIKVPRNRIKPFESILFKKYRRKEVSLIELVKDAFLSGLSTRKVGDVLEGILEYQISATTVSNIAKSLDTSVKSFHTKGLEDKYRFLFFDGINLKVKSLAQRNAKTILVAYGITWQGIKEIVAYRIASSESELECYLFVDSLYRRGLVGKNLDLVTIDGSKSLSLAVSTVYPFVPLQRCWVHKLRNIASKLPKKGSDACLCGAKKIYLAASRADAAAVYKDWAASFKDKYPKAVACLEKDIDNMIVFFDFKEGIRVKIRTTNVIERSFREVRRRTRPIGCFENQSSLNRILFGIVSGYNKNWKDKPLREFTQRA